MIGGGDECYFRQAQDELPMLELVAMAVIGSSLAWLLLLLKTAVMVSGLRVHHCHHLRRCLHMVAHRSR